ncbi:tetratricopeptide repeat protein [Orbus sturtevantii]|uniref:tetratricopeptide repeat protein n=1 Tax=Orbus sturtevantii TaxID=3074109 RepID=UPI00370D7E9A
MPFIGIGLSTIIAICFAIHAIRSGQGYYWLFILFFFPFLGSIVYFFAIFLPSLRNTRSAYQIESKVRNILSPGKELKAAQDAIDISPTVDNQVRLAKALVDNNRPQEAIGYYQQALSGIYKTAPDILLAYAYALFKTNNYLEAKNTLEYLSQTNPNYRSDQRNLLYANTLAKLGEKEQAREQYKALIDYYPSLDALSQYLQTLVYWQEFTEAKKLIDDYERRLKLMPKHVKRLNSQWIKEIEELKTKLK